MLFLVLFHTDMYHAKLKMKTYLLTTVLDSKGILSECKAKMRELLQSVETYRSQLRPLNENEDVDTTFLADRPSRAKKILSFIENTVYLSASAGEGCNSSDPEGWQTGRRDLVLSPIHRVDSYH